MTFTCNQNILTSETTETIFMLIRTHEYYSNLCSYDTFADIIHYDKFIMLKDIRAFIFNTIVAINHVNLQSCKPIESLFQILYFQQL